MKRIPLLAAAVLALGLVSGCSANVQVGDPTNSPSPSASPSTSVPSGLSETYTDDEFGFSFSYGPPFELNDTASFAGQGGGAATKTVAVFDTDGAQIEGQYRDAFVVSVYKLNTTITDENLPQAKQELESTVIPQLKQSTPGIQLTPLRDETVAGKKAFAADASFDLAGTPVKSTLYFIFDGTMEYQILVQAVEQNWTKLQPTFDKMLASFTITGAASAPASPAPSAS